MFSNVTHSYFFKLFCRYKAWLPDKVERRHDTKTTYQVEIRYANNTNETFTFHGPPGEFPPGSAIFKLKNNCIITTDFVCFTCEFKKNNHVIKQHEL